MNYLDYFGGREAVQRRFADIICDKISQFKSIKEKERVMKQCSIPLTLGFGDYKVVTKELVTNCVDALGIGVDEGLGDLQLNDNQIVELNMKADEEFFMPVTADQMNSDQRAILFATIKAMEEL